MGKKLVTGYSYFCDFFALMSAANVLSSALIVNTPWFFSIVEKSSASSYCFSQPHVSVNVCTATLAEALKPSARYNSHRASAISPTNSNSVENERITPE